MAEDKTTEATTATPEAIPAEVVEAALAAYKQAYTVASEKWQTFDAADRIAKAKEAEAQRARQEANELLGIHSRAVDKMQNLKRFLVANGKEQAIRDYERLRS